MKEGGEREEGREGGREEGGRRRWRDRGREGGEGITLVKVNNSS